LLKILKDWDNLNKEMWIFGNRGFTLREAANISEISLIWFGSVRFKASCKKI